MSDDDVLLDEKQAQAVELALVGMNDVEIAKRIKVSRQTVNKWRNHDADFIYLLTLRRQTIREQYQDAISQLVDKSLRVLTKALDNEDDPRMQVETAKFIMRISGLQGHTKPAKMPTREEVEQEMIRSSLEDALKSLQEQGYFTGI